MPNRGKCLVVVTFLLLAAAAAVAQQSPAPALKQSGLFEYTSFAIGDSSSAGFSSELDSAIGYDFSPNFSIAAGAPFYLVNTTQSISGTTTRTSHSASLGDAFLRLNARRPSDALNYATALTLTAPTGDTSTGASTGRATVTWNNRFEHAFDRVTPFAEGSIGNSLNSTRRYRRDYTTLGAVSEFRGGIAFDLLKQVSFESSAFADVGYGNQKIFSRVMGPGTASAGAAKHGRVFETAYLTSGTSGLVNDNGLTEDLSWHVAPRVDFDIAYNHSLHFATDSVAASIGIRLGHLPASHDQH